MRVLVIGAYGLIGSYVAAGLDRAGHGVVGVGRDRRAMRRFPSLTWIAVDLAHMLRPADWLAHLRGIDAVVNCAGALQDNARDDVAAVHVRAPAALYQACLAAGVRRIVHVSAAGVGPDAATPFETTKLAAEQALQRLDADWLILRPGLVLAPAAYGGSALLRGLAAFPLLIPAVHARSIVQIVSVHDVAEAVLLAIGPEAPVRRSIDLVSPEPTSLADVLRALRVWLGLRPAAVLDLPPWLAAATARLSDGLAWLGWRSPLRSTSLAQLRRGVAGDAAAARQLLGREPLRLAEVLAAAPSGVQERWFARLYFVKPLALAALALFWLLSGLVGVLQLGRAAQVLTIAGWPAAWAQAAVIGGACIDIALGVLVCLRRTAPAALLGMLAVSVFYLAAATAVRPDLWADPLGPLLKVIPGAGLALAVLAMMDER